MLIVAGIGLLRAPYRRDVLLLALSVLGIAAFTMVFQGRSRYLFAFVPLVVVLAASVHASFLGQTRPGASGAAARSAGTTRTPTTVG